MKISTAFISRLFIATFGCLIFHADAQRKNFVSTPALVSTDTTVRGDITFHADERIDSIEKKSRNKIEIKGYRIQIYLGTLQDAKNVRSKFVSNGMNLPAYIVQNPPDYVVRVGDFRTNFEAYKYYDEIKSLYPGAMIVVDKIEPPKFKKEKE